MQASHGLDVVVEDVRSCREHRLESLLLHVEEVGRQNLDRGVGKLCLERADRGRVVAGAAIGNIVAVDGRDDDVLQLHLCRHVREPQGLQRVGRALGLAGMDVAVAAGARAGVTQRASSQIVWRLAP